MSTGVPSGILPKGCLDTLVFASMVAAPIIKNSTKSETVLAEPTEILLISSHVLSWQGSRQHKSSSARLRPQSEWVVPFRSCRPVVQMRNKSYCTARRDD